MRDSRKKGDYLDAQGLRTLILTAHPSVTQKEIDYVTDAITNGHGEHWGDYVQKFEKEFAKYLGVKHAIATSSCTGALHLSLAALGIGPGDEVIIPDTTWIATAAAVTYVGAIPIFAEVLPDSWCLSPDGLLDRLTHRTRAIIPVHTYGHPCDMNPILKIANEYDLKIIEDAAPALGTTYMGKKVGTFGHTGTFSFQGAKMLSTGEGGMVVTNDDNTYERLKHFSNHGRIDGGFEIYGIGFKYKMSNLQAAWGLAQIERIDELLAFKRQVYRWYVNGLEGVGEIALNKPMTRDESPNYWMNSIVLGKTLGITRHDARNRLKEMRVDTRPFFPPISTFRMFRDAHNLTAKYIGANGINLPSGYNLIKGDVFYICDCIREILSRI